MKTIIMDSAPVRVRGEELDTILWQGRQWAVTKYGVECRDGTYAFEAKRLSELGGFGDREGLSDWLFHLAEKEWCDLDDFCDAWLAALALHPEHCRLSGIVVAESVMRAKAYRVGVYGYTKPVKAAEEPGASGALDRWAGKIKRGAAGLADVPKVYVPVES